MVCLLLTVLTGVWFGAGARNTRLTFDNTLTANRVGWLTLLATWRHMTRCYNIHALLHELWRRSFLYSWTKPSVVIIYRSYAIWLWRAVLRDRWSTLSSAPSLTSQRKQSMVNCVFNLSSPRRTHYVSSSTVTFSTVSYYSLLSTDTNFSYGGMLLQNCTLPQFLTWNLWKRSTLDSGIILYIYIYIFWRGSPPWVRTSSFTRFLDHTQRRITVGRTPPDEWSARRRDLYLITHNTHNIHAPGEIRTHNLSKRATADPRLRRSGHWDRQRYY